MNKDVFQLFGLLFLKNEEDLDGNGTDEVGLVIDWTDWSNVNGYIVYANKNNKCRELLTFN